MNDSSGKPVHRGSSTAALRGAAQLATEATAGLVDLVEAVHAGVARVPGLATAPADGRTRGITGLVYRTVRGVTRLVGGGVDALLGVLATDLAPPTDAPAAAPARGALLAALNGVLGDHLEASANPLATAMSLRHGGRPLPLQADALRERLPTAQPAIALLVHGLCMDERAWPKSMDSLLEDAGCTALTLRYNSGLPVARNGAELAALLEGLHHAWPVPPQRVVLLGHSMGGLVLRSALHQAQQQGLGWPARVSDLFCLGTPHHGAPLERLGHLADRVLAATPYAAPFTRLGRLRSAGITDLRHGRVLADDDAPVPLPAGVRCFALAGQLGEPGEHGDALRQRALRARQALVGDGLVTLASALGHHRDRARALHFEADRTWVGPGIGHLELLSHPAVLARLRGWLPAPGTAAAQALDQSATASR